MKNFKQIALGLLVGGLAIGFSAFTSAHNNGMKIKRNAQGKIISVTSSFYRLPAYASNTSDTDPSHYVYSNTSRADCNSASDICKSEWTTTNAPSNGQSPSDAGSPSYVSDDPAQGVYNGE